MPKPLCGHDFVPFQTLVFGAAGSNFVFCLSKMEYYSGWPAANKFACLLCTTLNNVNRVIFFKIRLLLNRITM